MPLLFFDLPREIRDEVYHHVFPGSIRGSALIRPFNRYHHIRAPLGLLRTCSQAYDEAIPHLYRHSEFLLHAPHQTYDWINTIGSKNANHIRTVVLMSNFLTRDIDEAGQQIAAQTWAKVLRSMTGLLHLKIVCASQSRDSYASYSRESCSIHGRDFWTTTIYQLGQTNLPNALYALEGLQSIIYEGLFYLAITNNKSYLKQLVIEGDLKPEKGRSIESYFDALPRLNNLRFRTERCTISDDFFAHVAPLSKLEWDNPHRYSPARLSRTHFSAIVKWHGSSLVKLSLKGPPDKQPVDNLGNADFQWLVTNLPHLRKLSLWNQPIDTSLLAMLPTRVQRIRLGLLEDDPQRISRRLKLLEQRGSDPQQVILLSYRAHDTGEWSGSWAPMHRAIRELSAKGFNIRSICCRTICNIQIHDDPIDLSGLIP